MEVDKLKALHTALIDTRAAYELAAAKAESPPVISVCKQMVMLRREDHAELHRALLAAGETPDENGSFMTTVHETVVSVRAAITGISEKTLPAFIGGEEEIVKLYDEAIQEDQAQQRASDILVRQRANLMIKIGEMKQLAA
jgi:uncharacterized protein (TIGR02284 family)